MKINFISSIIAIGLAGLFAFGFYTYHAGELKTILSVGSFVFFALTLLLAIGVSFEGSRTTTNIRVLSGVFFFVALISQLIFHFFSESTPAYIIVNGIILLIYLLIINGINRAAQ